MNYYIIISFFFAMVLYLSISHQNKIISKKFAITLVKQKKSTQYISEGVIQFPLVHLEN